jgi:DNA-binding CsgD family transcriptional regulator
MLTGPEMVLLSRPSHVPPRIYTSRYGGPERRSPASVESRRLAQMLDEIDYGMLLVDGEVQVRHANQPARRDMDDSHPLQLIGSELRARRPNDMAALRDAVAGAARRGLRRLLRLGLGSAQVSVAVVPLPAAPHETQHAVLLLLGKRRVCEELTVDWYARTHGLTIAETAVIKGLGADLTPQEIAVRQGVGLATIRTQIGSIRTKTGTSSIKALVRQVAMLPPLVGALRTCAEPAAASAFRMPERLVASSPERCVERERQALLA